MIYSIIRSSRRIKTIAIEVNRDMEVIVRAPVHTSCGEIDRFVKQKHQWLRRQILRLKDLSNQQRHRTFAAGEEFLYLGESYTLKIYEGDGHGDALILKGEKFLLRHDAHKFARILFQLWYQRQARLHFLQRVGHFGLLLGLEPRKVTIGNAKSRWASCSPDDGLRFSWRLIMAPPEVIDYVVVHELCHLRVRNHSRAYWLSVEEILPDHKKQRDWLKKNGRLLTI